MNSVHRARPSACGEAQARRGSAAREGRPRAVRRVGNIVLLALLAACGAGTEEPKSTTTTVTTEVPCATAPTLFSASVWPSMNSVCTACHAQGGIAGGTALVFTAGGSELQNYNVLRDYARASGSVLLSKTIGLPSHAGGAPYVNANSSQYKDLAQLVPQMTAQVCTQTTTTTTPPPGPTGAGGFWQDVALIPDTTVLAKASVLFAGRNPTPQEVAAVGSGGTPALRQTIRGYMQGPVFERFLNDVGDTHFLSPGVVVRGNDMGYNPLDWPTAGAVLGAANVTQVAAAEQNRFDTSARREAIELMKFIVRNDRPYTDMVSANYTVVNGILAQYLGAAVQGSFTNPADDTEWRQATLPSQRLGGTREHAGVLSSHPWLQRFPTTGTNRNRHRVNMLYKQFLGTDVSALAVRPLEDGTTFRVPTVENPGCAACHDTIDPVAAGFQNWNERNRFLPNRTGTVDHALPGTYRSANYPKDAAGQAYYRAGDNWFRDAKAPGYGATPMPGGVTGNPTALQWLGQQVANDPRFALGAVHFWYEGVFGRNALQAPFDVSSPQYPGLLAAYNAQSAEFEAIAARFRSGSGNGAYNVRDLLVDLVLSQWFRAERVAALSASRSVELHDIGSVNMLPPSQLNQKLIGVVGMGWADFDNPYTGWALNYGDFDGVQRVNRAKSHTMMQSISIDRLVAVRSCAFTKGDFDKPIANRLLFPAASLTDTPASSAGLAAITQNVRHLHKWLWKEDVPETDVEVQRTLKLFTDTRADRATAPARPVNCAYNNTNDAAYAGRAWAAVIAYMLGDPKFLYE